MCLRNKDHNKNGSVCQHCLREGVEDPTEPDLNQVSPHLRAIFTQLTLQNRDLTKCWKSSYKQLLVEGQKLKIENIYYSFYKGDIGDERLRRTCITPECVNPLHLRSRFEHTDITKTVRAGFNRKKVKLKDLSDSEWLKQS